MPIIFSKRIISDPKILNGKPVIKGTRISVEFILELLRSGMTFTGILKEYQHLTKTDLRAVLAFAKHVISHEEIVPFEMATKMRF